MRSLGGDRIGVPLAREVQYLEPRRSWATFAAAWAHVMLLRLAASPAPAPSQMTGVREEIFAARSEIADLFAAARKFDARPVAASPAEKLPLPSPPPLRATTRMATLERHRGAVGVLSNSAPLRSGSSAVQHTPRATELSLQRLSARDPELTSTMAPVPQPEPEPMRDDQCATKLPPVDAVPAAVLERPRLLARRFLLWRFAVWRPKQNARLLRVRCAAANRALLRSTWAAWRRHLRNQRLLEAHDGRLQRSAKMLLRVWQTWASARQEMRQALGEEVARMKEELLAVRAHLDATQDELVRVHAVGEQREGSLKLELEQRNGAVRLELDRQKALAAQTIEELSSALETASAQLVAVHRDRGGRGSTSSPPKRTVSPFTTVSSATATTLMGPEAAQSEIDTAKEKARRSIKKIKSEADHHVCRVEADAVRRIAAAERKATEAMSTAQDELIELEVEAKKKQEVLRKKLKRAEQDLRHAQKMTEAARAERTEAEQKEDRAAKRDAAAEEKWARQLARQDKEWRERLDAELHEVRRSHNASEREQRAATESAQKAAEALSHTTSALERLLADLRDVDAHTNKADRVDANASAASQRLKIMAMEELESARRLLSKHRGDDERELRRARIWFAKQLEALEDEAALTGQSFVDGGHNQGGGRQRRRVTAEELDDRMVERVLEAFESKGALSEAQLAALQKLSGTKKIVKAANILQSWSFMDRLSTHAALNASDAARELRREQVRPKSPVRRVSEAEAKQRFDQIRIAQEVSALHFPLSHSFPHTNLKSPCAEQDFAARMEQERLRQEEMTAREATFVPIQTPAPPLTKLPGPTQPYRRPPSPGAGRVAIAPVGVTPAGRAVDHALATETPEETPTAKNESISPLRSVHATMDSETDADALDAIDSILLSEEQEQAIRTMPPSIVAMRLQPPVQPQQQEQQEQEQQQQQQQQQQQPQPQVKVQQLEVASEFDLAKMNPNSFVDQFLPAAAASNGSDSADSGMQMTVDDDLAARIRRVAGWIALQEFQQEQRMKNQHDSVGAEEVDFEAILRQRVAGDTNQDWRFLQGRDVPGTVLFRQELQRERELLRGGDSVAAE